MQLPIMALDGGQTSIKIRAVDGAGTGRELSGPGVRTDEPLIAQVGGALCRAMEETGTIPQIIAVGLSGLTRAQHDARAPHDALGVDGVRRVILAHDSLTSYLGALGGRARSGHRGRNRRRHPGRGSRLGGPGRRLGPHHGGRGQRVLDWPPSSGRRDALP
ncbi:hypothetical protein AAHB37_15355 [Glutamicibacter halophytocola]|uniref:hypothetical protein n=1 Tax=Glutamicibacter halophytocola TaxID=1933880 RepID=UPI003219F321